MHLAGAIAVALLKATLIIVALMGLLFGGSLVVDDGGQALSQRLQTPERLAELEDESQRQTALLAQAQARDVVHSARHQALSIQLRRQQQDLQRQLEDELSALEEAARAQVQDLEQSVSQNQQRLRSAMGQREQEFCNSWNPLDWITCRAIRNRADAIQGSLSTQQRALQYRAERIEEQAAAQANAARQATEERLATETARFEEDLAAAQSELSQLRAERQLLEENLARIEAEQTMLAAENWFWIELRKRWPYLLALALLIFSAPYLRRTFWYFVGMPLVSRARPIVLSPPADDSADSDNGSENASDNDGDRPLVKTSESARTLEVSVDPGQRLLARTGYIQSDRQGARSELFFDRQAPNLSYLSGLVMLTRLDAALDETPNTPLSPRQVVLGTPDEPEAYLMRVDLRDHPGIVIRASHVVAVIGNIEVQSTWRLTNLHAWATSQVRFITFSGTGSLILEGYGDIRANHLANQRERKRMTLVVGFDTRLTYQTQRSATFLPYLVDPGREPLVVDVFDGTGAVFYEKNPSARKRHRSAGEAIAGFFLDAIRKLLGL